MKYIKLFYFLFFIITFTFKLNSYGTTGCHAHVQTCFIAEDMDKSRLTQLSTESRVSVKVYQAKFKSLILDPKARLEGTGIIPSNDRPKQQDIVKSSQEPYKETILKILFSQHSDEKEYHYKVGNDYKFTSQDEDGFKSFKSLFSANNGAPLNAVLSQVFSGNTNPEDIQEALRQYKKFYSDFLSQKDSGLTFFDYVKTNYNPTLPNQNLLIFDPSQFPEGKQIDEVLIQNLTAIEQQITTRLALLNFPNTNIENFISWNETLAFDNSPLIRRLRNDIFSSQHSARSQLLLQLSKLKGSDGEEYGIKVFEDAYKSLAKRTAELGHSKSTIMLNHGLADLSSKQDSTSKLTIAKIKDIFEEEGVELGASHKDPKTDVAFPDVISDQIDEIDFHASANENKGKMGIKSESEIKEMDMSEVESWIRRKRLQELLDSTPPSNTELKTKIEEALQSEKTPTEVKQLQDEITKYEQLKKLIKNDENKLKKHAKKISDLNLKLKSQTGQNRTSTEGVIKQTQKEIEEIKERIRTILYEKKITWEEGSNRHFNKIDEVINERKLKIKAEYSKATTTRLTALKEIEKEAEGLSESMDKKPVISYHMFEGTVIDGQQDAYKAAREAWSFKLIEMDNNTNNKMILTFNHSMTLDPKAEDVQRLLEHFGDRVRISFQPSTYRILGANDYPTMARQLKTLFEIKGPHIRFGSDDPGLYHTPDGKAYGIPSKFFRKLVNAKGDDNKFILSPDDVKRLFEDYIESVGTQGDRHELLKLLRGPKRNSPYSKIAGRNISKEIFQQIVHKITNCNN